MGKPNNVSYTLQQLADALGASIVGDAELIVNAAANLENANKNNICFFADKRYLAKLKHSAAGVIITANDYRANCPKGASLLLVNDPQLAWLQVLKMFMPVETPSAGIHATAIVASSAKVDPSASVGPYCVIGKEVSIAANTAIAAGCTIADNVVIGKDCVLHPRVSLYNAVKIGSRTTIHSGAVIGADGFGNVKDASNHWHTIPHLGSVHIGDDVEIGANTTIDCGALEDSTIKDGVRIDNMVYLAHNVSVGEHTAIAAGTIVAGTVAIGSQCLIGGGCSIAGHLKITDNVILTATSSVSKSITKPGAYSSGQPVQDRREWQKSVVHYRNLSKLVQRIKKLEVKNGN